MGEYKVNRPFATIVMSSVILFSLCTIVSAQEFKFSGEKKGHPKLESVLSRMVEEHGKGPTHLRRFAQDRNVGIDEEDKVTVIITLEEDKVVDQNILKSHGVEVVKTVGNLTKARLPVGKLKDIADNIEGVSFIKLPDRPVSQAITTEGVALTGAIPYHSAWYLGVGVKVAIIDAGFDGLFSAWLNSEMPDPFVLDCTGTSCTNITNPFWELFESEGHGTAVAEIVHDMAPGAELYLLKIEDGFDLLNAVDFCVANGIRIINHSMGWWNQNFYDGTCYPNGNPINPVCIADYAYANGILWVNSSGNNAQSHYQDTFTDLNLNGFHDQPITFFAPAGTRIQIYLTWNAWPYTNQDYDLFLVDGYGNLIAESVNLQTGSQFPVESIITQAGYSGTYYISVRRWSATANHQIKVWVQDLPITPAMASNSLLNPADAASVLSVGAIDYPYWTTGPIADYSSQGPTTDGRLKPEISAPAKTSGLTYGVNGYSGTSAASPHVAGAAALILSANPGYTVDQLRNAVISSAIDMGSPGPDNVFGFGRLSLPTLKPNLAPYIPAGWSDKIVVSKTTGTNTDNSPLYATDALYVDWAVTNNGSVSTSTGFSVALYVDGIIRNSWNSDPVSVDYYTYINDYSIGPLGAGTHTVKIVSDSTGMINERDEGDNEYTKTITVLPMPIVEFVSTPAIPDGATTVNSGSSYAYSTGGSSSSLGHPIQYFLDWGDGSNSGWLPAGTTSAQKAWSTPGTYLVKAQARCATHTSVVSGWSVTLSVTISETVGFNDVSASHWAYNQIMAIYHEGITGGCSTNPMMYCPDAHITRAQMAVFMETSLGRTPAASCNGTFSDVDAGTVGDVVCRFIEDFAAAGITGDAEEEGFVLMTQ